MTAFSGPRLASLLSTGLLAALAFGASAQTAPATGAGSAQDAMPPAAQAEPQQPQRAQRAQRRDPAQRMERMRQHRAQRLAALKQKLNLSAAQEASWNTFTSATQPPAGPRMDRAAARAEFEHMTTPQRLERMQARQSERADRFARRAEATRAFYATLTPAQQKTFDTETLHFRGSGRPGPQAPR